MPPLPCVPTQPAPFCASLLCHAQTRLPPRAPAAGLDGCSKGPVVVLKSTVITPDNAWVAPTVATLMNLEVETPFPYFLYTDDGEVVLPTPAELEANAAAGAGPADGDIATPAGWYGAILAPACIMDGDRVEVVEGVEAAEDCARLVQAWTAFIGTPAVDAATAAAHPPNLFNYCPANSTEDCRCAGPKREAAGAARRGPGLPARALLAQSLQPPPMSGALRGPPLPRSAPPRPAPCNATQLLLHQQAQLVFAEPEPRAVRAAAPGVCGARGQGAALPAGQGSRRAL